MFAWRTWTDRVRHTQRGVAHGTAMECRADPFLVRQRPPSEATCMLPLVSSHARSMRHARLGETDPSLRATLLSLIGRLVRRLFVHVFRLRRFDHRHVGLNRRPAHR